MPPCAIGLFPTVTPGLRATLRDRWACLMEHIGAPDTDASSVFGELVSAYGQPHRHYHTLAHIAQVLAALNALPGAGDPEAVQLAAWFHDVVYDPACSDNEEQSAVHAGRVLRDLGVAEQTVERVQRLVRATATHEAESDPDAALLVDADLAPLGVDWRAFQGNSRKIRREFAFLSETDYLRGRAAFLRSMLRREQLFQTQAGKASCEEQARANLTRALRLLEPGSAG